MFRVGVELLEFGELFGLSEGGEEGSFHVFGFEGGKGFRLFHFNVECSNIIKR